MHTRTPQQAKLYNAEHIMNVIRNTGANPIDNVDEDSNLELIRIIEEGGESLDVTISTLVIITECSKIN